MGLIKGIFFSRKWDEDDNEYENEEDESSYVSGFY